MIENTINDDKTIAGSGKVVAANIWGKLKTVSQMAAVMIIMLLQYLLELNGMGVLSFQDPAAVSFWFGVAGEILLWMSVVFTVISGLIYIVRNFAFIRNAK